MLSGENCLYFNCRVAIFLAFNWFDDKLSEVLIHMLIFNADKNEIKSTTP